MARENLNWESKLILLIVVPFVATGLVLQTHWWATQYPAVAIWTLGLSLLLALVVLRLHAATAAGTATGAAVTASLMFSTVTLPYLPWHTALPPVLAVSFLAWAATRVGRKKKERLGVAEPRRGRSASQIAANLGVAALVCSEVMQSWLMDRHGASLQALAPTPYFALGLAALAEAAADTVSSELGQVLGGRPRMITTLKPVEAGTDGAISLAGTLAGIAAASVVAALGTLALRGGSELFWIGVAGGVFGLFFDSVLGATLERRGWLNNDAVNFLSTASAVGFAFGALLASAHFGSH